MRTFKAALFPILLIAIALLGWLWWNDAALVHRCEQAGGRWDPAARLCQIDANRYRSQDRSPAAPASPRR